MERPFLKRCTPVTLHLEDQPQLQWEFQARLGYLKPCLKKAEGGEMREKRKNNKENSLSLISVAFNL